METTGNSTADLLDQERERSEKARVARERKEESAELKTDYWLTTDEVCGLLNMSRQALWRAVRAKQIPHQRFSKRGRIKFVKEDIERFVEVNTFGITHPKGS